MSLKKHKEEVLKAQKFLARNDEVLKMIIKASGDCDIRPGKDHYKRLLDAIVGQQLSVKAAATIRQRVYDLVDSAVEPPNFLDLSHDTLRSAGLSNQKATYVRELSLAFNNPSLKLKDLHKYENDKVFDRLIKIKGIGEWSVHMFLMFGLGRLDILPHGDLGIQIAARKFYRLRDPVSRSKLERIGGKWKPYRTVASWYLWRGLELK